MQVVSEKSRRDIPAALSFRTVCLAALLHMTLFTFCRSTGFFVAALALAMEGFFCAGYPIFGPMAAGTFWGFDSFVVAFCAIRDFALMLCMSETDITHLCAHFDICRSVGCDGNQSRGGYKANNK